MSSKITFHIGVGIKGPISEGSYEVKGTTIDVEYPAVINLGTGLMPLPNGLSTVFTVSWIDTTGRDARDLTSKDYEAHLVVHKALDAINELLQAYKLVRMGHLDGCGVRTIGIYDTLFYFSLVDGRAGGGLNVGWRAGLGEIGAKSAHDPFDTTALAKPHIDTPTLPVARRFLRCYELLEHGFYSESFIVAFSTLDDLTQEMLHAQLIARGMSKKAERGTLLRGIKESRLKLYLGPVLKLAAGKSISDLWGEADKALQWVNTKRNDIAHGGHKADYHSAAVGIYACIKLLHVLHEAKLLNAEFPVEFFRHAKLTASWTSTPPAWVPRGATAESMDYVS